MRDPISQERIRALHPKIIESVQSFIEKAEEELNITLRIVQGFRTFKEQADLYAQGRTKPGRIVTWSPAGASYHNYGLAIDIVPIKNHVADWNYHYKDIKPFATEFGFTWGGDFPAGKKDLDHFENKFGYNWRTLLDKHNRKDFIPNTQFVNI